MILCIVTVKPQNGEREKAGEPKNGERKKAGGAEGKTAKRKSRAGKAAF